MAQGRGYEFHECSPSGQSRNPAHATAQMGTDHPDHLSFGEATDHRSGAFECCAGRRGRAGQKLSNEFGKDGILVNNVAPGYTATERLQELAGVRALAAGTSPEEIYRGWAAETPVRRLGEPGEIADLILWLASERAAYITGQTVLADGGIYPGL